MGWNPREYDNLGTIVAWHRRYAFSDNDVSTTINGGQLTLVKLDEDLAVSGSSWNALKYELIKAGAAIVLPVYLYDHGVQVLSTESFIGRVHHAEWDSGQVGFIFVTKAKLR
jgi:hypothetical protein